MQILEEKKVLESFKVNLSLYIIIQIKFLKIIIKNQFYKAKSIIAKFY